MTRALAPILTLASLVVAAWGGGIPQAAAHVPHPGLHFSIGVAGVPGCDTTQGDKTCSLVNGTPFTVDVVLGPLPSDIVNYDGFDLHVTFTGVVQQGQPSTNAWPDCGFPVSGPRPGDLLFGCAIGLPPAGPSTYSGTVGTVNFTCTTSGSVVLVNGEGDTDLSQPSGSTEVLHTDQTPTETLTIVCANPGPGVATPLPGSGTTPSGPPATPLPPTEAAKVTATARVAATATAKAVGTAARRTPTGTPGGAGGTRGGGGGIAGWAIALIAIGAIVGVGGAGYAGWRYWQSRTPSGGA